MPATTEALIQKTPNLMGGEACIRSTRIAIWGLVEAWRLGFTDDELLNHYVVPLTQDDLDAARAYYQENPEEIEAAIRRHEDV